MAKSNLTAKTLMLGHKVSDTYGKANVLDLITINTNLTSATVPAGGVAKLGDFVHVFPFLSGNVGGASVIGETLVLNVSRFVDRIGLKTQKVTVTFTDTTGVQAVADINAQLVLEDLDNILVAELKGTRIRLKVIGSAEVGFSIDSTSTGLVALGFTAGEYGKTRIFKLSNDLAIADTTASISEFYTYGIEDEDVGTLAGLSYQIVRFMGESTGATLGIDSTDDEYKGSNLMSIQVESSEMASTLSVTELEFKPENLSEIYGFKKRALKTFFSGQACDSEYNFGTYSNNSEFSFYGYSAKSDGVGLIMLVLPKCLANGITVPLGKAFRVSDTDIQVMADVKNRTIGRIYSL